MGLLQDGVWRDQWYDTSSTGGRFVRSGAQFRNWITPDGSAGPTGEGGFKAEPGRYHLYVSLACPWANRTLIFLALKGLEDMIGVSVVNPYMAEDGWTFLHAPGVTGDLANRKAAAESAANFASGEGMENDPDREAGQTRFLHEVYTRAQSDYSGRVTVPVLWDCERNTIVNNESSEIIRMLNSAFDGVGAKAGDYAPAALLPQIDEINAFVYDKINNGVYKAGFATSQDVYEQEVHSLFTALDEIESRLSRQRYLVGDRITEADWRLFTTLIRFDPVYHGHFKCNIKRLADYENLWAYTRELYQWPGIAATVDFDHIKQHYYRSHNTINPNGIVPAGPELDLWQPHGRG